VIEEISIRDLGVIRDAQLNFGAGLTVLTGETGAGKTMVLTALGLLLGERADSTSVRQGQPQAFVEGRWLLPQASEVIERVLDAGGFCEDGELILNRSVSSEGRSRASAGGRGVPAGLLSEIGDQLVIVHGQADQLRLRSSGAQREALDQFGGVPLASLLGNYRASFTQWREAVAKLASLRTAGEARTAKITSLREAVADFEQIDPKPGEDIELADLAERLTHSEDLRLAVSAAHEAILSETSENTDAISQLGAARKSLEQVAVHDEAIAQLANTLKQLGYQINDAAAALNGYLAGLEGDTALQLEHIQYRRAQLATLVRKYGPTYIDALFYRESAQAELLLLDSSGESIEVLEANEQQLHRQSLELAEQLSRVRQTAAIELAAQVTKELAGLAMAGATLVVSVREVELSATGKDAVAIELSAYPGAEPRAISKGASGGELSRIMLAIEVVLAKTEQAPTFIFDEVDAGVGGAAAIEVGKRLARLAKQAQVIVVTHLAQVAAFANQHLKVSKSVTDEFTASSVVSLDASGRIEELARMLSGLSDSDSARVHATELIALGNQEIHL
jgi:DNA repair protein RecN (Recombination protein N)